MSDTSGTSLLEVGPLPHAWAVASLEPARRGSRGFVGHAWAILDGDPPKVLRQGYGCTDTTDCELWVGVIAAILEIMHAAPRGCSLTILTTEEWIAGAYDSKWRRTNGEPKKGSADAKAIFELRAERGLLLSIEHRKLDDFADVLKMQARKLAQAKSAALIDDERRAVPAFDGASDFTRTGGFPKARPDADNP